MPGEHDVGMLGGPIPAGSLKIGNGGFRQALPSLMDLEQAARDQHDRVAYGYEVLAFHYLQVRRALCGLIGSSSEQELLDMELVLRSSGAPEGDKAAAIDAVRALLASDPGE